MRSIAAASTSPMPARPTRSGSTTCASTSSATSACCCWPRNCGGRIARVHYQRILEEIAAEVRPLIGQGRVAEYIPPLAAVPHDRFGMVVRTVDGQLFVIGDAHERFSIQSIAKVFALTLAMKLEGEARGRRHLAAHRTGAVRQRLQF